MLPLSLFLLPALLLSGGCSVAGGIFSQIVNERALFNGSLNDKASPLSMTEDDRFFYVIMNRLYQAEKRLIYPKGYQEGFTDRPLTEKDENRSVLKWESLDLNIKSFFPNAASVNSVSCRHAVVFNGVLYASFSDDSLTFDGAADSDSYSKVVRLLSPSDPKQRKWEAVPVIFPKVDSPAPDLTDPARIDPQNDRVFSYHPDFSFFEKKQTNGGELTGEAKAAFQLAKNYDRGQIRRPELIRFFEMNHRLYGLFSETYLKKADPDKGNAAQTFAKNPVYRLFRLDSVDSAPALVPVFFQNDPHLGDSRFISEITVMEAIRAEMQATGCNFATARLRVFTDQNTAPEKLSVLRPATPNDKHSFYLYDPKQNKEVSYTKNKRLFRPDAHYAMFTRSLFDQKSTRPEDERCYLFHKNGLFRLTDADTDSPKLKEVTEKLPQGMKIKDNRETFLPPDYPFPDQEKPAADPNQTDFKTYRYCDCFLYSPNDDPALQRIEVAWAMSAFQKKAKEKTSLRVAGYEGDLDSLTADLWKDQKVNTTHVKESGSASGIRVTPTAFAYYRVPKQTFPAPAGGKAAANGVRQIDSLLMGSNNGFYHATPNPGAGNAPAAFDGPKLDLAGTAPVPYEKNIFSLSLSGSHITGFYASSATVTVGGSPVTVPVLFAFTAENGLWLNYNRFWNRE